MLLRLIGPPALQRDAGQADEPLEHKDAGVLAVLALEGPTPRDILTAWFWPDAAPKAAAGSLRQRIFRLRRRGGHALVRGSSQLELLDDIDCDARSWLGGSGAAPAGPGAARPIPAGELLAGIDWPGCPEAVDWLRRRRAHWRNVRRTAWAAAITRLEAAGDLAGALEQAEALARDDPLSEHAAQALMRLHHLRGDAAAAIKAFESLERVLKDELGARPAALTLELLRGIEARRPGTVPGSPAGAGLLRPPRLIGRDADLSALVEAWSQSRHLLLLGDAGIGKSRLLAEFCARHPQALRVQARPGDANLPYAVIGRLLRALAQAVPAAVPVAAAQQRELERLLPPHVPGGAPYSPASAAAVQAALEDVLLAAAAEGRTGWIVDDLHYADAASVDALRELLAAPRLAAVHWVFARRSGADTAAERALVEWLEDSQRLVVRRLTPLSVAQTRELVDSLAMSGLDGTALAEPLVRHCGGNPLYVLETLKDLLLRGGGPALPRAATVGVLIERRLRTLSPVALALARLAALAGADFSIDLAEHVLQAPAIGWSDAWTELETAHVLQGRAFAHDLVHDAVRESIPPEIAGHTHGRIAAFLQARGAPAATRAHHWQCAGGWRDAADAWTEAARHAQSVGRRDEQCRFQDHVVDCLQRAGDAAGVFAARLARLESLVSARGSAVALAEGKDLLRDAPDPLARLAARARFGHVLLWVGQHAQAEQQAAAVLAEPTGRDPAATDACLEAAIVAASAMAMQARPRDGAELLEAWSARVDDAGNAPLTLNFAGTQTMLLLYANRRRDAARAAARHVALARTAHRLDELREGLANLGIVESVLGQIEQAIEHTRESLALARGQGDDSTGRWVHETNLGYYLQAAGRYDEALELLQAALQRLEELLPGSQWGANAQCFLAEVMIALGQPHRMQAMLGAPAEHFPGFLRAKCLWARARVLQAQGQDGRALLGAALPLCEGEAGAPMRMSVRLELTAWLAPTAALDECDAVRRDAERTESAMVELLARQRRIEALLRAGHASAAAAEARQHMPLIDLRRGPGVYPPAAWLACARAFESAGQADALLEACRRGRSWIEQQALPNVPQAFRPSFLQRNADNRALLALARAVPDPRHDRG